VDGHDDDNGSQGVLSSGGSGGQDDDEGALFDLEELLFPKRTNAATTGNEVNSADCVAVKEETNDFIGRQHDDIVAATLMTSNSWPIDNLAAIKVEEGGFINGSSSSGSSSSSNNATSASTLNDSGVLADLDNCFSELFPDLAVAEAGIVM